MRRLAVQDRKDDYGSRRDYQKTRKTRASRLSPLTHRARIVLLGGPFDGADHPLVGFGGFVKASKATELTVSLHSGTRTAESRHAVGTRWQRLGMCLETADANALSVTLMWDTGASLDLWGVTGGRILFPRPIKKAGAMGLDDCNHSHLMPETFYFDHSKALALTVGKESTPHRFSEGDEIELKKCSYCGRNLPLDMKRLGALSFHKHNAKLTNHQNECRACKKWRINNSFNPLRTTDQLHESSAITRERKLLLREPEILQAIKKRTGAGLKSQVWERFSRRCFYCGTPLKLGQVQLDHTRPLAYLWPIDKHATCLCATHNNEKKEKFPVDFYTDKQLRALSRICGLSYEELCKKELNGTELQRVLKDIAHFAEEWDPRTFAATARKIAELRPDIDLYQRLQQADKGAYDRLVAELEDRPDPVPTPEDE